MMKKILLATALALPVFATSSFAGDCHPKAHGGFAIGLHGGYVTTENRVKNAFFGGAGTSDDVSGRGGAIGLDLSYGHVFANKLFAGLEVKADLGSLKGNNTYQYNPTFYQRLELKSKESYGAALKLGGLVDKALPYITVGVVSTKFEATRTSVPANPLAVTLTAKNSKRLTGFEVGAGVDLPLSDHITMGARYVHTEYGKMTSNFTDALGGVFQDVENKPRTNAFLVNFKYRVW